MSAKPSRCPQNSCQEKRWRSQTKTMLPTIRHSLRSTWGLIR